MPPYDHCVFFLLDGARPDVMGNLFAGGDLPNLYKLFVDQGTFTRATTSFPSTTGAAYLPYLTGFYPGHCNIPGIRWFDRREYAKNAPIGLKRFRSYVGVESFFLNKDLPAHVKTLFEYAKKPMNVFNPVTRGSGRGDRARLLMSCLSLFAHSTKRWQCVDRWIGRQARRALKKRPDVLFVTFPAVDEMSHRTHPFSNVVLNTYRQFDREVGKIVDQLKQQNIFEQTLFMLGSDHGLSATHTHFDLVAFMESQGYQSFYYPKIFRKNFNVAIMQSGNSMAHLYIKKSTGWAFKSYSHDLEGLMDALVKRREVSWVASLTPDGVIYVRGHQGEAWIREEADTIHYRTQGGDPFLFKQMRSNLSDQESLERTFSQDYPDAPRQLLQLFKSERTGDLVVNAAPGYDLRLSFEWPEHFSSHGSLHRDHMHIPIASSHPLTTTWKIRSVDIFPTILRLLGISGGDEGDGKVLIPPPNF